MFNCAKISKLQLYYKKQEMHTAVHLTVVPLNSPEISLEVTLLQVPHILQVHVPTAWPSTNSPPNFTANTDLLTLTDYGGIWSVCGGAKSLVTMAGRINGTGRDVSDRHTTGTFPAGQGILYVGTPDHHRSDLNPGPAEHMLGKSNKPSVFNREANLPANDRLTDK